jgi:hypothetical protein
MALLKDCAVTLDLIGGGTREDNTMILVVFDLLGVASGSLWSLHRQDENKYTKGFHF